ncbi:MAG: hypothetical protein NZ518_07135, partial [Dehalococcoidia bacterium]|nr:hypothetical protein [Dehalococcoidia bacterium]
MSSLVTNSERSVLPGFRRETVEALSARKNEPEWLRDLRLAAWETFEATPWPSGKEEAWRRLDLSGFTLDDYTPYTDPGYRLPDRSMYRDLEPAVRDHLGTNDGYGALVQHDSEGVYQILARSVADTGL